MEIHKITWKTNLLNAAIIIYYFLLIISVCIYFIYSNSNVDDRCLFLLIMGSIFTVQFLPQILLHVNYWTTNKHDILKYDPVYKQITFCHENQEVKFSLSDIKTLTLHKSFAMQKNNVQFLAVDNYNHGVIVLEDGTIIVVTSLLIGGEFKLPIPAEKIKVKSNIYRWAKGPSLQLANK